MEYDAEYTCRTCLCRTDSGTSILEPSEAPEGQPSYEEMLAACLSGEEDTSHLKCYPHKLCAPCLLTLPTVWKFMQMCRTSHKVLHKYFANYSNTDTLDEGELYISIKEEIKQEEDFSDAASVKSEGGHYSDVKEFEEIPKIKKTKKKFVKGQIKRKIDKLKNADIKSQCPVCDETYDTELKLRKHMIALHPDSSATIVYKCKDCKKQFKRKTDLSVHRRIHSGDKPFKCTFCPRSFAQSGSLMEHSRVHTGETPFACKVCKKVFSSRSSFYRHRLVHNKEKLFACELCGKTFGHKETLKQHRLVHSEARPFVCDICKKALKSKYALLQHLIIHNEKDYVCEHCGKKFSTKYGVQLHIKTMHSENAGECCICLKVTSNLSEHMITHSTQKPYKCTMCGREFKHKNSLTFHITMHKNADKYKCEFEGCRRAFPKVNMLTFHVNKIHSNKTPHICPKCSKGFYRGSDLSRHINTVHLDVINNVFPL